MRDLLPPTAPALVRIDDRPEGLVVRFQHEAPRWVRPAGLIALLLWGLFVMVLAPLTLVVFHGWFRDALLAVWIALAVGGMTLPVAAGLLGLSVKRRTVARATFGPHRVHLIGLDEGELGRWTVHDLVDVWASEDRVSPIVAVQLRSGGVEALRVDEPGTAHWLVATLQEWRTAYGTEPDEEAQRLLGAMRERALSG